MWVRADDKSKRPKNFQQMSFQIEFPEAPAKAINFHMASKENPKIVSISLTHPNGKSTQTVAESC